jgi:hypothetical protein
MTTLQKTLLAAALVIAVTAPLYLQHRAIQNLRAENTRARELAAAASRETTPSPALSPTDAAELVRLRREHDELLRLRGEVSRLRQQLAEAAPKRPAPAAPAAPPKEAEQPPEPVQIFVANADATVPAGQTLAFGGWATSPGKRMFVFVQPKILELSSPGRVGSVLLVGRFIEVSEQILARVVADLNLDVLENLKAAGNAASTQSLLTAEQATLVLQMFENTTDANVLSGPRIQTGDGVQATLSQTEQQMVAGQERTLGPTLDVEPRIAADGSSVNLTVSARLRQANPAQ